ncbi:MAG: hypothetical protein H7296_14925 [Bacteroidia bacterium]|nr:hypothetical protein [Bacteroidia bacterium]
MMHLKFSHTFLYSVMLLFYITPARAQKSPVLIDAKEIVREGVILYDEENYDAAIKKFIQVHPADSSYFLAQYELSLTYLMTEEYLKVIAISEQVTAAGCNDPSQYNLWGASLKKLKRYEEALAVYNKAIVCFPYNEMLHVNKGFLYEGMGEPAKALEVYKNTLKFAPQHSSTHLRLAQMNVNEGNLTQAIMSYTIYLMLEPATKRSLNVLGEFNKLCDGSATNLDSAKIKVIDREFNDINFLVSNQVALNDKYKVPGKFSFPVIKQVHLIMEKLSELKNPEPGYYADFYLPFFVAVNKTKSFETFALLLLAASDNENISKQVGKKVKEIKAVREECLAIWTKHHSDYELTLGGKKQILKKWYYNDFSILAFGNENTSGQNTGDWLFLSKEGSTDAIGQFNEKGEKTGSWHFFHTSGDTSKMITYKAGKSEGPYKIYRNSFLKETGNYINGNLDGEILDYYSDGTIASKDQFLNNKRNGAGIAYYIMGNTRYQYIYENNLLKGAFTENYPNNKLAEISTFEAGKHIGNYKLFYIDGQLKKEFNYTAGIIEGPYKTYWRNGTVESEGNAVKGSVSGKWKYYYSDSSIKELSTYDESGKVNGEEESFDHSGKKFKQASYLKGDLKKVQYYNPDGKVFYESKIARSGTLTSYFNYKRDKISDGKLLNGERDGEWRFYYISGQLSGTEQYIKKNQSGPSVEYFKSGKLSIEETYKNNYRDGFYKSFFSDGKLHVEGNYREGDKWGSWFEYYQDGQLKKESYYIAGDLRGIVYEYGVSGKLYKKYTYNNYGSLIGIYNCDTNGIVIDSLLFKSGTARVFLKGVSGKQYFEGHFISGSSHGKHQWLYPNGKLLTTGNYFNGYRDGSWIWYNANEKPASSGLYFYGEKTGVWEYFDFFGNLVRRTENKFGETHGKYTWYYKNGKIESESNFYENERHGGSYYYAGNGDLRLVRFYDHGKYLGYSYHDKNKKLVDTVVAVNGEGSIKSLYPSGIISSQFSLKCGEYHGVYKLYFPDGKLQEERLYEFGVETGPTKEYFNDGKLSRIENYNNGSLHGQVLEYNLNGSLHLKESYRNDVKEGLCEYFDNNGKRTNAIIYSNDEAVAIIQ